MKPWLGGSLLWTGLIASSVGFASAQEDDSGAQQRAAELAQTAEALTNPPVLLRYQFAPGEVLRWKVVHMATTETTIQGNTQTSKSRSLSTKVWTVKDVDSDGQMTFEHSVADMDMWQKVSDRPEIRYNSRTDATPPPEYSMAAKTVGVPLTVVTVSPAGEVLERERDQKQLNMGLGQIILPLPKEPVQVGAEWYRPNEVQVRLAGKEVKRIKTRLRYRLEKIQTGVATISVQTEVLTPVNDPKIRSQLMQEVTNGTIKFDVDAGRMLSQQVDWDESVVGFSGADSSMKYLARFTEELLPEGQTTAQKAATEPAPRR